MSKQIPGSFLSLDGSGTLYRITRTGVIYDHDGKRVPTRTTANGHRTVKLKHPHTGCFITCYVDYILAVTHIKVLPPSVPSCKVPIKNARHPNFVKSGDEHQVPSVLWKINDDSPNMAYNIIRWYESPEEFLRQKQPHKEWKLMEGIKQDPYHNDMYYLSNDGCIWSFRIRGTLPVIVKNGHIHVKIHGKFHNVAKMMMKHWSEPSGSESDDSGLVGSDIRYIDGDMKNLQITNLTTTKISARKLLMPNKIEFIPFPEDCVQSNISEDVYITRDGHVYKQKTSCYKIPTQPKRRGRPPKKIVNDDSDDDDDDDSNNDDAGVENQQIRKGFFLKETVSSNGKYVRVRVSETDHFVHNLVAEAYLGPPVPSHAVVDHINGNFHDNRVENLRWIDPALKKTNRLVHKVVEVDPKTDQVIRQYSSIADASRQSGIPTYNLKKLCETGVIEIGRGTEKQRVTDTSKWRYLK